ncbi:DUF1190 domain-containing protein [Marinobacter hydrocarbonoclasticus]|uniref:DUF1190 domain-containing protein n=1 Tax=Marinobacter nauticus TaxID=2743 RepID=UPI001A8FACB3|nr:DUF1190 domain-containing protein [Marinobacter nauticus]MBN8239649.1 DUF1190 domain-containing protein [Marinobacter nauticus]
MAAQEGISTALKTRSRRQKRSQAATLVLMGATPLVVLGFDPWHTDVRVFRTIDACQSTLSSAQGYCEDLEREVALRHAVMAPKYTSRAQCEADFAHVINEESCKTGWCSADNLATCEQADNGLYQPPYSGFLVDQSVLDKSYHGEQPDPSSLSDRQLQPVYGISDETLKSGDDSGDGYSHHSHVPFFWHYVTANGQYLGNKNLRGPVTMARTQLAGSAGKVYNGKTQRGGFGSTARQTMQAARS